MSLYGFGNIIIIDNIPKPVSKKSKKILPPVEKPLTYEELRTKVLNTLGISQIE